jgi:hypothetical protein
VDLFISVGSIKNKVLSWIIPNYCSRALIFLNSSTSHRTPHAIKGHIVPVGSAADAIQDMVKAQPIKFVHVQCVCFGRDKIPPTKHAIARIAMSRELTAVARLSNEGIRPTAKSRP